MWRIVIGGFQTKDEAEHWKESKVKGRDWHAAIVEEVEEELRDLKERPATKALASSPPSA